MLPELKKSIDKIRKTSIPNDRKIILQPMIDYIQHKIDADQEINLNFICTHNSRRSQFSQIWAKTAADYFGIPTNCYSGGVEVTAFNKNAVESIKRSGFKVSTKEDTNPVYSILTSDENEPFHAFSKLFDDPTNKAEKFAAIMTCSHADENCPFIPGAEVRISVNYDDPKAYDGTPLERDKYDERSLQIASEMFYVFSKLVIN